MRSTTKQKLTSALLATCLGVGWVSAGNLDQLNYVQVNGNRVQDLFPSTVFPDSPFEFGPYTELIDPNLTIIPDTFIATTGGGTQNSATWLRGWIEPPMTGPYVFWVSGNDDAEFYLNTTPGQIGNYGSGRNLEAYTDGSTGAGSWAVRASQKSRPITLTKGQQYYFEVIQKTGGAAGGLAQLGWWMPDLTLQRPIPIRNAQRFAFAAVCNPVTLACTGSFVNQASQAQLPAPVFNRGPGGATSNDRTLFVTEGESVDLSPWVSARYPVTFTWFVNGQPEAAPNSSAKYFERVTSAQNGNVYHIQAGNTVSSKVTLTVVNDTTAPTVEFASTSGNTSGFNIIYSENVDPATATDVANYSLTGNLTITDVEMLFGATEGNIVVVTTDGPLESAETVTINNVKDASTAGNTIADDTETVIGVTDGILTFNAFGAVNGGGGIGGVAIANFAYDVRAGVPASDWVIGDTNRFPNNPDYSGNVIQAAIAAPGSANPNSFNFADNYGAQLVGYLIPPETGLYNFIIAADDQAILLLSTDADPANRVPIAIEPVWRPYRNFTATDNGRTGSNGYRTQVFGGNQLLTAAANQSKNTVGPLQLTAGNKYFFEALMKEAGGGDNLDVTWQLPSDSSWSRTPGGANGNLVNGQAPIPGQYFSLFSPSGQFGPVLIVNQPEATSTEESRPVTLSVVHQGSPSFEYQWYKDGTIIPDANARELYLGPPLLPVPGVVDNGAEYTVRIRNLFSQETSAAAVLTVTDDVTPPGLIRAYGATDLATVTIQFDEVVDPVTASNPANYSIAVTGGGANLQILGAGVGVRTGPGGYTSYRFATGPQSEGVNYTVTINNVKDISAAGNVIAANSTVPFSGFVASRGLLVGQIYRDIGGVAISGLLSSPKYPASPDETVILTSIGFPTPTSTGGDNYGDNFGIRIAGQLTVPSNGNYRFFTRSDDASQFFLNTTGPGVPIAGVNAPIAEETGCCTGYLEPPDPQTSVPIALNAGTQYGFMYLVKEGGGGDWGGVALRREGDQTAAANLQTIQGASVCCALANPDESQFSFSSEPASATVGAGTPVTLTAGGSGTTINIDCQGAATPGCSGINAPIFWQWQRKDPGAANFVDIVGANGTSYTTVRLREENDQSEYRVLASIPGLTSTSAVAVMTVVIEDVPPEVVNVTGAETLNQVRVYFSEAVDSALALNLANYSIAGLGISSATLSTSEQVVTLTTATQTPGQVYNVTVENVADYSANTMVPYSGSFTAWELTPGFVMQREYWDIGGGSVANLTGNAKFPNRPDRLQYISAIDTPPSDNGAGFNNGVNRENFGTYMTGWLTVPESGNYHFAISGDDQQVFYLSTDETPANLKAIVAEPQWNGWRSWNTNDRRIGVNNPWFANVTTLPINRSPNTVGATPLVAGELYYFEAIAKEGGGGDSCAVTWWLDGGTMPADNTPGISAANVSNYVNPDNTINISAQPASAQVPIGAAASLSVTANSTEPRLGGPITYQWYKNTIAVSGATGRTLNIAAVAAGDFADYYVVMNAPGAPQTQSATATLSEQTVIPPGPTLSIVNNGDGSVTVSYPTTEQAAGNQLQSALNLDGSPIAFTDDTSGADNAGSFETTKSTATDGETYWRTEKP